MNTTHGVVNTTCEVESVEYLAFEFSCKKNCKQPCIECLKKSFGKIPKKLYQKPPKTNVGKEPKKTDSRTAVQKVENDLAKIPLPIPDSIEVHRNVSSNKEQSHKMKWKRYRGRSYKFRWSLPSECYNGKCEVCGNLSCCNYYGLFSFFGIFSKKKVF